MYLREHRKLPTVFMLRQGSALRSFRDGRSSFYLGLKGFRSRNGGRTRFSALSLQGRFSIGLCQAISPSLNPPRDWLVGAPVNFFPIGGRLSLLCRLNECSWRHIAIQILYVRSSVVRPFVRASVKVSVNLFQIAPVRTGLLQL